MIGPDFIDYDLTSKWDPLQPLYIGRKPIYESSFKFLRNRAMREVIGFDKNKTPTDLPKDRRALEVSLITAGDQWPQVLWDYVLGNLEI